MNNKKINQIMKMRKAALIFLVIIFQFSCTKDNTPLMGDGAVIDHHSTDLSSIPAEWIEKAKRDLHIAYGHTSHGSQLTDGMSGLVSFMGDEWKWNRGGRGGALDLHDYAMPGDLGNPDRTTWEKETRKYLAANPGVNVIIWSWCGQVSSAGASDINRYLNLMNGLEKDFPGVIFVYMTGHLDGTGENGNLHQRNEQIRQYCRENNKYLFDFADIESYDPDGNYFLDRWANDGCYYDANNDGKLEANWAVEWQNSHTRDVDWYECGAAHTQPLNANLKAYAAWHLWARIAGWNGK